MSLDREEPQVGLNPLAAAIAARCAKRPTEPLEVSGVFDLRGVEVPKVFQRCMTKSEENEAVKAARIYVQSYAGADATSDPDIMLDAKNVEAMFRACRDAEGNAIFPGPQWMRDNMTTDQVGVLLNGYLEARKYHGGAEWGIDDDRVEALVLAIVRTASTDIPELVLATTPREALTSIAVILATKLHKCREDLATAVAVAKKAEKAAKAAPAAPPTPEEVEAARELAAKFKAAGAS